MVASMQRGVMQAAQAVIGLEGTCGVRGMTVCTVASAAISDTNLV